jgi:GrpB-like predicted nucleotidyltransferase (UPF0157 family)
MHPAWANEPVVIVSYDPSWAARGQAECRRVAEILGVSEVEHIGSTAVPGLSAKPILDIMARVDSLALSDEAMTALAREGFHHVPPDLDGRDWRKFFVKTRGGARAVHLHVLDAQSPRWERQLAFRDRLRASPAWVAEYSALKTALAARHRDDREAYTNAKTAFIEQVLRTR